MNGAKACRLFKPWSEFIQDGECLFYGNKTKCCFQAEMNEDICPWNGKPPMSCAHEIKVSK
jgi:hypothetical protein